MANNSKKFNIIIDTNVIISAFISPMYDTSTSMILQKLYNLEFNMYYSEEILNEYKDVLNRRKFNFKKDRIGRFINFVKQNGRLLNPEKSDIELIDIKDKPFYEIVMDKSIDNAKLITGNIKHFPLSTKVITPKEFIDLINKK